MDTPRVLKTRPRADSPNECRQARSIQGQHLILGTLKAVSGRSTVVLGKTALTHTHMLTHTHTHTCTFTRSHTQISMV